MASPASQSEDPGRLVFDRSTARLIDEAAVAEFGIPGIVLMENAARGLAERALIMLARTTPARPARVLIVCGWGNNGGDGYAAARHLHNRGVDVALATLGEPRSGGDAAVNRDICARMNLPMAAFAQAESAIDRNGPAWFDLVIDAIFGTGLDRAVTGEAAAAIAWINSSGLPVLAADVPSGMDCDTGLAAGGGACVKATATVTFAGMKIGFLQPHAREMLGEVIVADIGAPRGVLERLGRRVEAFAATRGGPRR